MATSYYGINPIDYRKQILGEIEQSPVGQPTRYSTAYGGIPTLPDYTQDVQTTIGPDVQAQLIANQPYYQENVLQSAKNTGAGLKGMINDDVLRQIWIGSAQLGRGRGMPVNTPSTNAAYLAALGLNSYQIQQQAEANLTGAIQRTPIQQMQTGITSRDLGFEQAQYAAAPDPRAAVKAAEAAALRGAKAGAAGAGGPPSVSFPSSPLRQALAADPYAWQNAFNRGQATSPPLLERSSGFFGGEYNPAPANKGFYPSSWDTAPYQTGQQPTFWDAGNNYGLPSSNLFSTDNFLDQLYNQGITQPYQGNQPVSQGSMYITPTEPSWESFGNGVDYNPSTDQYYDYWTDTYA